MAEHGAAVPVAAAGGDRPGPDEPRRRRDRSRSPRAQIARHHVRNLGILRGGTAALTATLNVVNARVDNLDRIVRGLSSDASRESLPVNFYQNINNAITQAREVGKIVEAMRVAFQTVAEDLL